MLPPTNVICSDLCATIGIAPQGLSAFAVSTKIDQVLADLSTGVDVINATGIVMRLQYEGRFAQDLQQNSVNLKGSVPFCPPDENFIVCWWLATDRQQRNRWLILPTIGSEGNEHTS